MSRQGGSDRHDNTASQNMFFNIFFVHHNSTAAAEHRSDLRYQANDREFFVRMDAVAPGPAAGPGPPSKRLLPRDGSNELEIARMQGRRMYAHQRDCVPLTVNGYHRIAVAVIDRSDARGQRGLNLDHVLARIKTVDGDCADRTGRRLV